MFVHANSNQCLGDAPIFISQSPEVPEACDPCVSVLPGQCQPHSFHPGGEDMQASPHSICAQMTAPMWLGRSSVVLSKTKILAPKW